jgi:hypothetical protein
MGERHNDCSPQWGGALLVYLPVWSTPAGLNITLMVCVVDDMFKGRFCCGFGFVVAPAQAQPNATGFASESPVDGGGELPAH